MKNRFIITSILFSLLILASSCGNSKKAAKNKDETMPTNASNNTFIPRFDADFIVKPTRENWDLEIRYLAGISFRDHDKDIKILTHNLEKQVAQGANVVSIYSESDKYEVFITIDVVNCKEYYKSVNVLIKEKNGKKEYDYEGCGYYRGQQQLHDIWVVESLNGKPLSHEMFPKNLPNFEFNLVDRNMSGFGGCNQVNSNISFDYNKINFEALVSTRMYCEAASNVENQILEILRANPTYKIDNLRLYLEVPGRSLILKKVD